MLKELTADKLTVRIYETREEMGQAAARDAAARLKAIIARKGFANVIFAAAPSQNEALAHLAQSDVPFDKINALHMDEYVGLSPDAPQGFGNFLKRAIFDQRPFRSVQLIAGEGTQGLSPEAICERYARVLAEFPPDLVLMGIGENGHIAFNDPPTADFDDPKPVKLVELEERCRRQQVHDGCFEKLEQVPKYAVTLTIPTLMAAPETVVVVPAPTKREALTRTVREARSTACPATVLRAHEGAALYADRDSGADLL